MTSTSSKLDRQRQEEELADSEEKRINFLVQLAQVGGEEAVSKYIQMETLSYELAALTRPHPFAFWLNLGGMTAGWENRRRTPQSPR